MVFPRGLPCCVGVGRGTWVWVGDTEGQPARAPLYCAVAKHENERNVGGRGSRPSDRRGGPCCPSGASLSGLHVLGTRVPVSGRGCVFWPSGPCGLACRHLSSVRGDRWGRRLRRHGPHSRRGPQPGPQTPGSASGTGTPRAVQRNTERGFVFVSSGDLTRPGPAGGGSGRASLWWWGGGCWGRCPSRWVRCWIFTSCGSQACRGFCLFSSIAHLHSWALCGTWLWALGQPGLPAGAPQCPEAAREQVQREGLPSAKSHPRPSISEWQLGRLSPYPRRAGLLPEPVH